MTYHTLTSVAQQKQLASRQTKKSVFCSAKLNWREFVWLIPIEGGQSSSVVPHRVSRHQPSLTATEPSRPPQDGDSQIEGLTATHDGEFSGCVDHVPSDLAY